MKLSSERREMIAQSPSQSCQIQISSIEKTLVGQGPLKNGMTIIGTLSENSDIEVELRLPAEANEQTMMFQSKHTIEADAQICDWTLDVNEQSLLQRNSNTYRSYVQRRFAELLVSLHRFV